MTGRNSRFFVLVFPALFGCAELRSDYTPSSGMPIQVYDKTNVRVGEERLMTGQNEVRDMAGNVVATSTQYQNTPVLITDREWFPIQGNVRLDDESFYRITGDRDAVAEYSAYHQSGFHRNTLGFVVGAIGLAVLGGGGAMVWADTPPVDARTGDPLRERSAVTTIGYAAMLTGLVTTIIGVAFVVGGKASANAKYTRLIEDPARAKADADRYNQGLGVSSGPSR